MKTGILFMLMICIGGCVSPSKVNSYHTISNVNKDVFILSSLIQDYLRKTKGRGRDLDLNELIERDTSRRIPNNFEKIELISRGGHIAVKFKFLGSRNQRTVELADQEKAKAEKLKWIIKDSKEQYDGEIQFEYGERFHIIRKIIIKKGSNVANTAPLRQPSRHSTIPQLKALV
ncbi:hypothetical protein Q0590_37065 [Rhodocytophaga aerolata]|uniref:Lipoprotein n=1 Tax=Rhodocytophaga aerolata TaxID=455078 RepID=A0ABT8RIX7_9BACT|nr:hypothetical protein [Rhodocytophaga aerolata]MDO1451939.1 hypothetical protein [Rhodocytophaga aerolata]